MNDQSHLKKALPYYKQIQQTIKERIFKGTYKPGDRLYEAQIAKQFGISRSPVREAIRGLINEGLLIMDEKSQISVYKPSLQDVRDIYDCRIALESTAVALATERATVEELDELENLLVETSEVIKRGDRDVIVTCNARFHELIMHISRNERLLKLIDELHALTYFYRFMNIEGTERAETILKGHTEIYEAIKERNPAKAVEKLKEHTYEDLKNLVQIMER
jgi:DNA-binding GntR family transcriptional regulator